MTDPLAGPDARQLIAAAIAAEYMRRADEHIEADPEGHAAGFADAVLALFGDVEVHWLYRRHGIMLRVEQHEASHSRLVLSTAPVEVAEPADGPRPER